MFYKPTTVASMVAVTTKDDGSPYDLYSDLHKDAIGCRPGQAQWGRYNTMTPIERIVEHKRLGEWMAEDERIEAMRTEVAKFDFSRGMEYLMRRAGMSALEAFKSHICECSRRPYPNDEAVLWDDVLDTVKAYGWEFVAMDCRMPQRVGAELKAMYEELKGGE
jgi:hypothetical protein